MFFPREGRRRRKSSPEPDTSTSVGESGRSSDLVHRKPVLSSESALPTHYTSNTSKNFLLGGHYYPGKDKRLRRRRGRRLHRYQFVQVWAFPVIVLSFVLWYTVVPVIKGTVGSVGIDDYERFLHDKSYTSGKSLKEEIKKEFLLSDLRQTLRKQSKQRDLVLEQLAPKWYHRNDLDFRADEQQDRKVQNSELEDLGHGRKQSEDLGPPRDAKRSEKRETERGSRTIHSMDSNGDHSACPRVLPEDEIKTTLVLQSSLDRMWILKETCSRWKDPIVAVVAVRGDDSQAQLSGWKEKCPQLTLIVHELDEGSASVEAYPVNVLRNLGLDSVQTSHVLVMDIDFVPSADLDKTIRQVLRDRIVLRERFDHLPPSTREALVVPAFDRLLSPPCQTQSECMQHLRLNSSFIPQAFEDLKLCHEQKDCDVFQMKTNSEGHSSTRTGNWLKGLWYDESVRLQLEDKRELKGIRIIDCFESLRYEPYVVLRWCPFGQSSGKPVAPYYDERFYGYGKNKIQHVQHLRLMGYGFAVLPEGFLVHNPHVESPVKERWNDMHTSDLHKKMDELYMKFLHELLEKYEGEIREGSVVEACKERKHE